MSILKLSIVAVFLFTTTIYSQQANRGKANIDILKTYTQEVLGKNVGYYVEFKNNSSNEVDGLKWIASFYDNFGTLKGKRKGTWESGNFISKLKPGKTTKDLESNYVSGATKIFILITEVHLTSQE